MAHGANAEPAGIPVRNSPSDWVDVLRRHGLRPTQQRVLVLAELAQMGPATPEEVAQRTLERGVGPSTVYRALEALFVAGLVTHTHAEQGPPRWSLAGDHGHVHLTCHGCGRVEEVSVEVLAPVVEAVLRERGFVVDPSHFPMSGQCADCLREHRAAERASS
jgi:Fur family ferric uptake transcriptional regulator